MDFPPFSTALKNGTPVLIREVTQDDRHLLEVGFEHLSSRARYFRFLGAHKNLSERELDKFTAPNEASHVAVGAVLTDTPEPEPIGIARYIQIPQQPHIAEIAVTIADAYQRLGLGSLLLDVLVKFAQQSDTTEFTALVHRKNTAMLGMLARFGSIQSTPCGTETDVRIPVPVSLDHLQAASGQKKQNFKEPNQSASVWENEGGAILDLFIGQE